MSAGRKKVFRVITVSLVVITLFLCLYIMNRGLGLVDGLDFGAGAYFYADNPQLQDIAEREAYKTSIPLWVHIVLFLCWGWLMYRLWVWIDRK